MWGKLFFNSLVHWCENMSHVTCLDVSQCFVGSQMCHGNHVPFMVCISGSHSHIGFAFMIHDMIGHGMTCCDVMMNSFMISCESHCHVTKSVTFLELLEIQMTKQFK